MNASDHIPDRYTVLLLLRDASCGLRQCLKAMRKLEALPELDMPDDVRAGLLVNFPTWQISSEHLPRMMERIRLRIAAIEAKEATARAIEGGEA
jgi:hypothetical protein